MTSREHARLERIRTLLHRLAHVRDGAGEAELIGLITVETDAVRRARALARQRRSSLEQLPAGVAVDYALPPAAVSERRRALRA